jgi:hypothetical protein
MLRAHAALGNSFYAVLKRRRIPPSRQDGFIFATGTRHGVPG